MKLPNGYGNVSKLPGNRRNPYRARKTAGWETNSETGQKKQLYTTIGYYPTKSDALKALAYYNPSDLTPEFCDITFKDLYEKWSNEHFPSITVSTRRNWQSAFSYSTPLWYMPFKDIRVAHMEKVLQESPASDNIKIRMRSLYNLMFRYAEKYEIADKNYAQFLDFIKAPDPVLARKPFSQKEIRTLKDNLAIPYTDMILFGIYTGFRPSEMVCLQNIHINLKNSTIQGGLKTQAGKDRIVPIHPDILPLIEKRKNMSADFGGTYLFESDNPKLHCTSYDKYRHQFCRVMDKLNMEHRPHDTRHTFITIAKACHFDEYILKRIVGHSLEDLTEKTYTHRTIQELKKEMKKFKIQ